MNLLWQIVMLSLKKRHRICQKCGYRQFVPWGQEKQDLRCKHCGSVMPATKE